MVAIPQRYSGDDHKPVRPALEHRLPPQNLEAEMGVLGSVLLDNDTLHEVVPILKSAHFYRDAHQVIYDVVRDIYLDAKPVDLIILEEELKRRDKLDQVGGLDYLLSVLNGVPHAANAKYYAQLVVQHAVKRELIEAANEVLSDGYSPTTTAEELLERVEQRVFAIAEEQVTGDTTHVADAVAEALARIDARSRGEYAQDGVNTGITSLDTLLGPMGGGQMVVLAARPSMGKTAFALDITDHVAMTTGRPVLFVSLEMGKIEIAERLLCIRAGVDGNKIRTGKGLTQDESIRLARAYEEYRTSASIMVDDTPMRSVSQITANARRLRMRHEIGLVVVDYIQLIDPENARDSRQEQVAKISRRLKGLARDLGVPVIALSQLNRASEVREDHRPRMADLRESGAIEQDADQVLLLHRPEYYDPNDNPGIAEVIVAKNRNGATGTIEATFLKNVASFRNLDKRDIIPM